MRWWESNARSVANCCDGTLYQFVVGTGKRIAVGTANRIRLGTANRIALAVVLCCTGVQAAAVAAEMIDADPYAAVAAGRGAGGVTAARGR